jgi:hypothetical protein
VFHNLLYSRLGFFVLQGICLASSLLFSAFVSIELRKLCAVVHTEETVSIVFPCIWFCIYMYLARYHELEILKPRPIYIFHVKYFCF